MGQGVLLLTAILSAGLTSEAQKTKFPPVAEPTAYVDVFWGTVYGNSFPGVCLPFSMVRLGPDVTPPYPTTGYKPNAPIEGFSHTHLHGTGGGGRFGNVMVSPVTGAPTLRKSGFPRNQYGRPGYYRVELGRAPGDAIAELTSSERVGWHRYTFFTWVKGQKQFKANIQIDAASVISRGKENDPNSAHCTYSEIEVLPDGRIRGMGEFAGGWGGMNPYKVYFYAQAKDMPQATGVFVDTTANFSLKKTSGKKNVVAFWQFDAAQKQSFLMKVGISFNSYAQAEKNLNNEQGWDFEATRLKADEVWNNQLGKISIAGGTPEEKSLFYSSLYHTFIMPTQLTDDDPALKGTPHYSEHYCLWDVFRSVMPLHTLIAPERQTEIVKSLLGVYKRKGWLPDGYVASDFAQIQGGTNADVVMADALLKGLPLSKEEIETLWEAVYKNASVHSDDPFKYGRNLQPYLKWGFLPAHIKCGSSVSLEYAYNDYCIAQIADRLGKKDIAKTLYNRSLKVFELFKGDPPFFWAKDTLGNWAPGFKPNFHLPNSWDGPYFYEGSPYDYSLSVPHAIPQLIEKHKGDAAFTVHIDNMFEMGEFSLSNEPNFLIPYMYLYAGRPDKTSYRVNRALKEAYVVGERGLPGQDDSGATSSWYTWSSMGLFPVAGQDIYLLAGPLFAEVKMQLPNKRELQIVRENVDPEAIYIEEIRWNGRRWDKLFIDHKTLSKGGKLTFKMAKIPSTRMLNAERPKPWQPKD